MPVVAWALYDFANSPFTTLTVTFVYAAFFTRVVVGDEIQGTALWSRALTLTALLVALVSPVAGALADRGGFRKHFLVLFTGGCVVGSTALHFVQPGQIYLALGVFVLAIATKRGNGHGAFFGVLLGIVAVQATARVSDVSYLYYNLVGAAVAVAFGYVISLVFSSPERSV